jgi:uncharacterized membrane protein
MRKKSKVGLFLLTIISFLGTLILMSKLPAMVPMHWNLRWEVDRYDSKYLLLLTAALPIVLNIGYRLIPRLDPKKENYKLHSKAYDITIISTIVFLIAMNWLCIGAALEINVNMQIIIPILLGILFFILGNYMPTIKSNYTFGIKNPWTLADELIWKKTHRVGGYVFILSGVIFFIMAFVHNAIFYMITLFIIIIGIVGINMYSYLLYKRIRQ